MVLASAVTASNFGYAVGFLIKKTTVYGRFRFLWFQMLIRRTANSEN